MSVVEVTEEGVPGGEGSAAGAAVARDARACDTMSTEAMAGEGRGAGRRGGRAGAFGIVVRVLRFGVGAAGGVVRGIAGVVHSRACPQGGHVSVAVEVEEVLPGKEAGA